MKNVTAKNNTERSFCNAPIVRTEENLFNDCPYPDDLSRILDKERTCARCSLEECTWLLKKLQGAYLVVSTVYNSGNQGGYI